MWMGLGHYRQKDGEHGKENQQNQFAHNLHGTVSFVKSLFRGEPTGSQVVLT
jgi:hypothetical protein